MIDHTHIVRFNEVTPHEIKLRAASKSEALAMARQLAETLAPAARRRTFVTADTRYDGFEAEPISRPFRVSVEARAIYEIEVEASGADAAEIKAEERWNADGPEAFTFQDFMDVTFDAEDSEP